MSHFNAKLWKFHQLCVLQVLNEKRDNSSKKSKKICQGRNLYRNIVSKCRDIISIGPAESMSQQAALCHNKDQAEFKPEKKIVLTSHNSVATQYERLTDKCCNKVLSVET